ncbi:tail fiber protein [Lysinibacillus sp. KU-BSD001]|uniref:phage tail protein n=1 Tax=Lysinibacillus sp. KU-BSD001 TaxID=3141328 RepID=UPI0036ECF0B9
MEAYLGEIRLFAGDYAPQGWAFCNGQLLSIAENELLYALIGTTYGGDGQATFALPDYQSRVVMHQGTNSANGMTYAMGQKGGTETVTLTTGQLPAHTHQAVAYNAEGATNSPLNNVWAKNMQYSAQSSNGTMNPAIVSSVGNNQPHDNMMPYLTISYIIAVQGEFPPMN